VDVRVAAWSMQLAGIAPRRAIVLPRLPTTPGAPPCPAFTLARNLCRKCAGFVPDVRQVRKAGAYLPEGARRTRTALS
jgi:hypothetical protein